MKTNKNRLRLRKQVIYLLPVVILLTLLSLTIIITRNHTLAVEVDKQENLSSQKINDTQNKSDFQLSDLKYFQEFYKFVEKRQKDNTIIYYASIFKLDIDKTLEIAYKYTKNYEDPEFNKNFVIGPKSVKNSKGSFPSFEAGAAYFARDLYRYPERYGSSIYEIRLDESPTIKTKTKGKIIMDNGLTFEQYVGHICSLYEIDPAFTLAIINLESGYQSSYLFTNKNNVGGHRGIGGVWKTYTTLEAGVLAHVLSVKNIADKNKIDAKEMTNEEIYAFSGTYVTGSAAKPSSSWTGKVTKIKENISKKDLFTIKK